MQMHAQDFAEGNWIWLGIYSEIGTPQEIPLRINWFQFQTTIWDLRVND